MLVALIFLAFLNYQKDIYSKLSNFKLNDSVDYYNVLEISPSSSDT